MNVGERVTPECDILKTLQPKGLEHIRVLVMGQHDKEDAEALIDVNLAVGKRGKDRVIRMVKAACEPPTKRTPQAAAGEGKGDEG